MRGRPTCSCDRPYRKHIATLLRRTDPRGAMSCGSPMPRGEQIAKPAERGTRLAGPFFPRVMGWNSSRWTHQAVQPEHLDARADTDQGVAIVLAILSRSFAAWEQPELLSAELRAAFKSFDSSGHMTSRRLMTLQVVVPPPQRLGAVPHGTRVIAPITSGAFEGPRLRGRVLPGGGDWTLLRSDAVLELDLRITLETDDGALISMTSFGLRHGSREASPSIRQRITSGPLPGSKPARRSMNS